MPRKYPSKRIPNRFTWGPEKKPGYLQMYKSYNSRRKWYKHPHAMKDVIDGVGIPRRHRTTKYRRSRFGRNPRKGGVLMRRIKTKSGVTAWKRANINRPRWLGEGFLRPGFG